MSAAEPTLLTLLLGLAEGGPTPSETAAALLGDLRQVSPRYEALFQQFLARRQGRATRATLVEAAVSEPVFEPVAESAPGLSRQVDAERAGAEVDLQRLLAVRGQARLDAIDVSRRRMRSPLLVERLLEEARDLQPHNLREALALQEAASRVAGRVSTVGYGPSLKQRLITRTAAHRANTLRVLGELVAADSLWASIHDRLARYPLELPGEKAELLSLEASLRTDLRQFAEAAGLLQEAERIYVEMGDPVGRARTLIKRGKLSYLAGDPAQNLADLREALVVLNPIAHRRLFLTAQHNIADSLVELDRIAEAEIVVEQNLPLYAACDDPAFRIQLAWLQGRIARGLGRFSAAERHLREARNGFLAQDLDYDVGLVSLDLAALYLATGETAKVKELARLMAPIFARQRVHREATAALLLFQKAAAAERLTTDFVGRLRRYLLLARNDPAFRFIDLADLKAKGAAS